MRPRAGAPPGGGNGRGTRVFEASRPDDSIASPGPEQTAAGGVSDKFSTVNRRAFTVEEANALLGTVGGIVERMLRRRESLEKRSDQLQVLDALWGEAVQRPDNPDHQELLAHRRALREGAREIERLVREGLVARGIRFPFGGLEHGLVDFPSTLDGRWVYLCWRYGEPEVGYWHEVDGGYRGRRPITDAQRERMGRPDDPARDDDSALDF